MGKLGLLALTLCSIHAASSASHSLKYFYTAVTAGIDFPEFTIVGLVDDEQFVHYDSNIRRMIPKTEWMKQNEGADYWDRQTQILTRTQQTFKANIGIAMQRFSQTQGVHTLQWMYGCEWDDETGATGGFDHYGYDGEDFLTYDMRNQRFIAPAQQAFNTAVKWNHIPAQLEHLKQYLTQECVDWVKKYVSYGRSALERTVAPEVSLLQKDPSSPVVTCHVTGFYPRGVMVTWQRNGEDLDVDVELGETVPNGDGTFQTTSYLTVKPEDWKGQEYTCTVQHKSLKQDIVLSVKEENIKRNRVIKKGSSPPMGVIIRCVLGALILNLAVIGVVIWKKRSSVYGTNSRLQWSACVCVVWCVCVCVCVFNVIPADGNPEGSSPLMGIIIGCVVGDLILILAVIGGVVIWKNRSSSYGKTGTLDTDSGRSRQISAESFDSTTPMIRPRSP